MIPSTPATEKEILSFFQGSGFFIHCYSLVLPKWSTIVIGRAGREGFLPQGFVYFWQAPHLPSWQGRHRTNSL